MPLDKKPYQMETRSQIEGWLEQINKTPDAECASMLVARRLVSHGLGALDECDRLLAENEKLKDAMGKISLLSHSPTIVCETEFLKTINKLSNETLTPKISHGLMSEWVSKGRAH